MINPVVIETGRTFERSAIREFFQKGRFVDPITGQGLATTQCFDNITLKLMI